jgi:hypothetical protein
MWYLLNYSTLCAARTGLAQTVGERFQLIYCAVDRHFYMASGIIGSIAL